MPWPVLPMQLKVTKSQKVFLFLFHPQKKPEINFGFFSITSQSWFCIFIVCRWEQIENIFWDLATFKKFQKVEDCTTDIEIYRPPSEHWTLCNFNHNVENWFIKLCLEFCTFKLFKDMYSIFCKLDWMIQELRKIFSEKICQ